MGKFVALVIGIILGVIGGFVLANNLAKSGATGMPVTAFDPSPCADRVEHKLAFTAPDAQDKLTIQSSGPSCQNVVATVTITNAEGRIVFAHAQRIDSLMDPKINPVAVNGIRAVLNDYAALADGGARTALPEWINGAPEIATIAPYGMFSPSTGNMLYRRVRDANAPLLRLREGRESGAFFAYLPEIDDVEQIARYAL